MVSAYLGFIAKWWCEKLIFSYTVCVMGEESANSKEIINELPLIKKAIEYDVLGVSLVTNAFNCIGEKEIPNFLEQLFKYMRNANPGLTHEQFVEYIKANINMHTGEGLDKWTAAIEEF